MAVYRLYNQEINATTLRLCGDNIREMVTAHSGIIRDDQLAADLMLKIIYTDALMPDNLHNTNSEVNYEDIAREFNKLFEMMIPIDGFTFLSYIPLSVPYRTIHDWISLSLCQDITGFLNRVCKVDVIGGYLFIEVVDI